MRILPPVFAAPLLLPFFVACAGNSNEPMPLTVPSAGTGSGGQSDDPDGTGGETMGSGASVFDPPAPPSDDGPISAVHAAAKMGPGFNLGQMFENTQHPRTLEAAKAKIDAYYARGFRNVRIPVTWTETVGGDLLVGDPLVGDINPDHPRLAVIKSVVDYSLSQPGLFVVLNAHHEHKLKDESRSAVLERLWKDITAHFGDRGPRLIFEFLNEPHLADADHSAMPAADLRLMTGLAYDAVRAENPTRVVMIGGNRWFSAEEVPAVWTSLEEVGGGEDEYVMATFHHYNPWTFCGDNQGTYDDAWTEAQMSSPMDIMKNWADTVGGGMPVYIGEWGVGWQSTYPTMTCNNIRQWYGSFHYRFAGPRDQPTAVWDDGGWFRIFSHTTNDWDNNLIDCIAGRCDWDGTERFNAGCQ